MQAGEIQKRFRQRLKEWRTQLDHRAWDLLEQDGVLAPAERRLYRALEVDMGVPSAITTHHVAGGLLKRPDLREEFVSVFEARRVWTHQLADHMLEVITYFRLMETRVMAPPRQ